MDRRVNSFSLIQSRNWIQENVSILKEEESKRVHFQINHLYIEMEIVNLLQRRISFSRSCLISLVIQIRLRSITLHLSNNH